MRVFIYYGFCLTTDVEFQLILSPQELAEIWAEANTEDDPTGEFPMHLAAQKVCEKYGGYQVTLDDHNNVTQDFISTEMDENNRVVIGVVVHDVSPDRTAVLSIPDLEPHDHQLLMKFIQRFPEFRAFPENFWVFAERD